MASFADSLQFRVGIDASAFDRGMQDLTQTAEVAGKAIAVALAAGAGAILALAKGALDTGREFEGLETRLGTLMGSATLAQKRMEEIFDIASSTPFELSEIVEAEVNLRTLGVEAEKNLPLILDFAGAMGTDLASAAVEVGRAMQFGAGAVETISGRALRAQVELRTGADALKMTTEEFREELTKTLTDPSGIFAGGTAKLSATFDGMISNLQDKWTAFQKAVSDSGLFDAVKAVVGEVLAILNEQEVVVLGLADAIGENMVAALRFSINVIGGMVDGFDMVRFSIATLEMAFKVVFAAAEVGWKAVLFGMLEGIADFIDEIERLNAAMGDPLGLSNDLAAAWSTVAKASNVAGGEMVDATNKWRDSLGETDAEMREIFNQLGRGAEGAERFQKAIDEAASQGKQLNEVVKDTVAPAAKIEGSTKTIAEDMETVKDSAEEVTSELDKWISSSAQLVSTLGGLFDTLADKFPDSEKTLTTLGKVLGVAGGIGAGVAGVVATIASGGAAAPAGIAGVSAAIGAVTSVLPMGSFGVGGQSVIHPTGSLGSAPDHGSAFIRRDERILNGRASRAMGDEQIRNMNRGSSGGGGAQAIAVPVFRESRKFFRDEVRARGPLARALTTAGSRAGQEGF